MRSMRVFHTLLTLLLALALKALPSYASHGEGNITAVVLDPMVPARLYAGTTDRGVFKSTDGGATWSATGLTNTPISALAVDPRAPSAVYALTPAGVLKSENGAESWSPTGLMNELISGFIYGFPNPVVATVGTLANDPAIAGILYAGVNYATYDMFAEYAWAEVLRSIDGGVSWAPITPSGGDPWAFPALRSAPAIAAAALTPTTPASVYATGTYEYDVCWIRDEGATIGCALFGQTFIGALSLAVDVRTPDTIYAGTNGSGVYKSTDGGATWSGGGAGIVRALAIGPANTVYAGTDDLGVLKSVDGGASWAAVNTGLTSYVAALGLHPGIQALAIDPLNPATLYAGTAAGVFKSTDGGENWNPTGLSQHSPLTGLSLNPGAVHGGTTSTGSVTLNAPAPSGGELITLSSSNSAVAAVPATLTVAAGATSATFTVSTTAVTGSTTVAISATLDGLTKSAALTVAPILGSVVLNPNSVAGGISTTGTVWLGLPAPAEGALVLLTTSDSAVARVPATVTVAAGTTSTSFPVSTSAVGANTTVTISAAYGGQTRSTLLNLVPTTLSSLSVSPTTISAGSTSTGTVTLSVPAPASGTAVELWSSNTSVATVPASMTIAAGTTSGTFVVSANSVLPPTYSSIAVSVLARLGGATTSQWLLVTLPAAPTPVAATLSSLTLNPTSVTAGNGSVGTVTLSSAAPTGGAVVALSSSNPPVAAVPANVTVAAGGTSASFSISTAGCSPGTATLSGTYAGVTKSAGLMVSLSADNVAVGHADYFVGKRELRVTASSTNGSATLQAHVTSTGVLIGTMRNLGDGRYSGQFAWPANPESITVRSSLCGSATALVQTKR